MMSLARMLTRLPKTAKVGTWYLSLVIFCFFLYLHIPVPWLVRFDIPIPVRVQAFLRTSVEIDSSTIIVGNCQAAAAPGPFGRITNYGTDPEPLLERIRLLHSDEEKRLIVMFEVDPKDHSPEMVLSSISTALRRSFPRFTVHIIAPQELAGIAADHSIGDGIHLSEEGFGILYDRYPDLFGHTVTLNDAKVQSDEWYPKHIDTLAESYLQ
jgi:hypothetical protein